MAFADFSGQRQVVQLLQRSLERGRLAHAYLFTGDDLAALEAMARTLAKVLNCSAPPRRAPDGLPLESCDACPQCRRIDGDTHADIQWVRPESMTRVITADQMRDLLHTVHLKPTEAQFKVAVIVSADRLNLSAANAFLKTLEEPPARSILILLSTQPQQLLETILSRCLRLSFAGSQGAVANAEALEWLAGFSEQTAAGQKSLMGRYRLLDALLKHLGGMKERIDAALTARSPLERYDDVDPKLREKWEKELKAAIEAEYRWRRLELLLALQWWLRDVWIRTLAADGGLLNFPQFAPATDAVARRISPDDAQRNLEILDAAQRLLGSNVQESLALEVNLLRLKL